MRPNTLFASKRLRNFTYNWVFLLLCTHRTIILFCLRCFQTTNSDFLLSRFIFSFPQHPPPPVGGPVLALKYIESLTWSASLKSMVLIASDAFLSRSQPSWKISNNWVSLNDEAIFLCFVSDLLVSACVLKKQTTHVPVTLTDKWRTVTRQLFFFCFLFFFFNWQWCIFMSASSWTVSRKHSKWGQPTPWHLQFSQLQNFPPITSLQLTWFISQTNCDNSCTPVITWCVCWLYK